MVGKRSGAVFQGLDNYGSMKFFGGGGRCSEFGVPCSGKNVQRSTCNFQHSTWDTANFVLKGRASLARDEVLGKKKGLRREPSSRFSLNGALYFLAASQSRHAVPGYRVGSRWDPAVGLQLSLGAKMRDGGRVFGLPDVALAKSGVPCSGKNVERSDNHAFLWLVAV